MKYERMRKDRRAAFLVGMRAAARIVNDLPADFDESDAIWVSSATDAINIYIDDLRAEWSRQG